jgi:hypothetical protein
MLTYALILTFSTPVQSEEYVIDYNLTKQDCIERMHEEYQDSRNENYDNHEVIAQMYKDAVERYKAVAMEGKIVEASFKCVVDEY